MPAGPSSNKVSMEWASREAAGKGARDRYPFKERQLAPLQCSCVSTVCASSISSPSLGKEARVAWRSASWSWSTGNPFPHSPWNANVDTLSVFNDDWPSCCADTFTKEHRSLLTDPYHSVLWPFFQTHEIYLHKNNMMKSIPFPITKL